jgi:hypothetical protein
MHPWRAMRAVVVAFLANDPRLDALISAYRSQMTLVPELFRSRFEELVRYLNGDRRETSRCT